MHVLVEGDGGICDRITRTIILAEDTARIGRIRAADGAAKCRDHAIHGAAITAHDAARDVRDDGAVIRRSEGSHPDLAEVLAYDATRLRGSDQGGVHLEDHSVHNALFLINAHHTADHGGSHRGDRADRGPLFLFARGIHEYHLAVGLKDVGRGVDKCLYPLFVMIKVDVIVADDPLVDACDGAEGVAARIHRLSVDGDKGALDISLVLTDESGGVLACDGARQRDEGRADHTACSIVACDGAHRFRGVQNARIVALSRDRDLDGVRHTITDLAVVLTYDRADVFTRDRTEPVPAECLCVLDGDGGRVDLTVVHTCDGARRTLGL